MFSILINIIIKSFKLDKSLYKDNKYFMDTAIYFAASLILITSLISIIPNTFFLEYMSVILGKVEPPRLLSVIFSGFLAWFAKSGYLYVFGTILFSNKTTQKNFKKTLTIVGYAHAPFILNCLVINTSMLFLVVISYIWYSVTLIVGVNQLYQYKNLFKSTLIVLGPIIFLLLFTIFQLSTLPTGTFS